jgi:hypothetical protein
MPSTSKTLEIVKIIKTQAADLESKSSAATQIPKKILTTTKKR